MKRAIPPGVRFVFWAFVAVLAALAVGITLQSGDVLGALLMLVLAAAAVIEATGAVPDPDDPEVCTFCGHHRTVYVRRDKRYCPKCRNEYRVDPPAGENPF